jgi:phosphoglycerol transferase MdoB-like AlkP superfamily enzyme
MPNVYNFIKQNDNILYHRRIKKQTKAATSADGQMIINTGLLPIKSGATCYKHPYNIYPALSKLYNSSVGLIPGNLGTWNQKRMSDAYGFNENILNPNNDDSIMVSQLNDVKHQYDYILAITMASHSPFKFCAHRSRLELANDIPSDISYYLQSINFTDMHLGLFLNSIQSDSILQNSTIVITGDHTIFPVEIRKEFSDYCKANNLDYKVEEEYCPLIIYSPNIKEKTIVDEVAYQMDIYPTILHVIGAEDYYWKGFGVNLLDSVARQNRPISPEDAFELSDKLIRANYFKEIEDSLYSQNQK